MGTTVRHWTGVHCINDGRGGPKCTRLERHPKGKPMFGSRDEGRRAIANGPPFPCHKCLMAFRIEEIQREEQMTAEFMALSLIAREYAREHGEDILGAILRTSGHLVLSGSGIVQIERKIQKACEEYDRTLPERQRRELARMKSRQGKTDGE